VYFLGCYKRITKQHDLEQAYLEKLLKEWDLYCDLLEAQPRIKEIH
jgi:oxygen-independent coproporphyrinogen-3 oxidase